MAKYEASSNLSITQKLFLSYLFTGVVALFSVAFFFYHTSKGALLDRTFQQLSSINILKKTTIENYILTKEKNLQVAVENGVFDSLILHPQRFSDAHLSDIERKLGLKDIYVFDNTGVQLFHQYVRDKYWLPAEFISQCSRQLSFLDYTAQDTTKRPRIFLGLPAKIDSVNKGSIIALVDFSDVQAILHERTGMGRTGETYLVGADTTMRSSSRFLTDRPPGSIRVNTPAVHLARSGHFSPQVIRDYRGINVLSVSRAIGVKDMDWVILTEIDLSEAMEPIIDMGRDILYTTLAILAMVIGLTVYFARSLADPIKKVNAIIKDVSRGIFPIERLEAVSMDELGEMINSISLMIDGLVEKTQFADRIGAGDLDSSFKNLSPSDELGKALIQMRDKLKAHRDVERNIARQRTAALIEGQEQERNRISRELHDGLGQMLTFMRLRVGKITAPTGLKEELKELIDETIKETRRISNNVMPSVLMDFGLDAAINKLCQNMERYSGVVVDYRLHEEASLGNLDFEVNVNLYRVIQEALNNAIKHADATRILLNLHCKLGLLQIQITDDGSGFDPQTDKKGRGLENMAQRVELLKGTFIIDSQVNKGTSIHIQVPLAS
ncbi:MAG: sensor histidine kinase [Cytophagales bacterium]|nr:sensor histidine kinase [Cytophagales bacterium]